MLTLIAHDEVLQKLRREYLDLDELVERFDPAGREQNRTILDNFRQWMGKQLGEFDPVLMCSLIRMACSLARVVVISNDGGLPKTIERGRWWLSFATACNAPDSTRFEALELWAYGRSLQWDRDKAPDLAIQLLRDETVGLEFSGALLVTFLKMGFIEAVATILAREYSLSETTLNTTRTWCEEILAEGQYSEQLSAAAAQLGVQRPVSVEATKKAPATLASALMIWKIPAETTRQALQIELEDLLVELRFLLRHKSDALTERTTEQVRSLVPELDSADIQTRLSFAGQNLWDTFASKGDSAALTLSRRLFLFLVQRTNHFEVNERHRSATYHWWMNSQLPELLHTCALPDIFKEGLMFYEVAKINRRDFLLREGLVEAMAGECRRLELAGEKEERKSFLQEHTSALKQIHLEYVRLTGKNQTPTEEAAWVYLKPEIDADSPKEVKDKPMETFEKHPDLLKVLRSGSHEAVLAFVESNVDHIREILCRRLNVRLSSEHLLPPEDMVYQSGSSERKQPHPSFVAARSAMNEGQ